jgi:hypothetical protein
MGRQAVHVATNGEPTVAVPLRRSAVLQAAARPGATCETGEELDAALANRP